MKWELFSDPQVQDKNGLKDVIVIQMYRVSAEEDGISAELIHPVVLSAPDPQNFKAFDQVTEEEVLGWVKSTLGAAGVAEKEAIVQARIDEQKTPQPRPRAGAWQPIAPRLDTMPEGAADLQAAS